MSDYFYAVARYEDLWIEREQIERAKLKTTDIDFLIATHWGIRLDFDRAYALYTKYRTPLPQRFAYLYEDTNDHSQDF